MLTIPSLKPYTEFYSGDAALVQPPDDAPVEQLEAHYTLVERCRETGVWTELAIAGQTPTKFTMRHLTGDQMRKLRGMKARREIGDDELHQLAFRCAVTLIENCGDLRAKPEQHDTLGTILHVDITNALDALDPGVVTELGSLAIIRGTGGGITPHR